MTTPPVVSVTDELIAELEQLYIAGWEASGEGWNAEYPGDAHEAKAFIERMRDTCVPAAEKLLAERAELKRDAGRLEWMISQDCVIERMNGIVSHVVYRLYWSGYDSAQSDWYPSERAAIDAAMQS